MSSTCPCWALLVRGLVEFDGLWESPTGLHVVIEARTSEIYPIKITAIIGYMDNLNSKENVPNWDRALGKALCPMPEGTPPPEATTPFGTAL